MHVFRLCFISRHPKTPHVAYIVMTVLSLFHVVPSPFASITTASCVHSFLSWSRSSLVHCIHLDSPSFANLTSAFHDFCLSLFPAEGHVRQTNRSLRNCSSWATVAWSPTADDAESDSETAEEKMPQGEVGKRSC